MDAPGNILDVVKAINSVDEKLTALVGNFNKLTEDITTTNTTDRLESHNAMAVTLAAPPTKSGFGMLLDKNGGILTLLEGIKNEIVTGFRAGGVSKTGVEVQTLEQKKPTLDPVETIITGVKDLDSRIGEVKDAPENIKTLSKTITATVKNLNKLYGAAAGVKEPDQTDGLFNNTTRDAIVSKIQAIKTFFDDINKDDTLGGLNDGAILDICKKLAKKESIGGKEMLLVDAIKAVFGSITKILGSTAKLKLDASKSGMDPTTKDSFNRYRDGLSNISGFINTIVNGEEKEGKIINPYTIFFGKDSGGNTTNPLDTLYGVLDDSAFIKDKASVLDALKLTFGNITKIFGATAKLNFGKVKIFDGDNNNNVFKDYKQALKEISDFIGVLVNGERGENPYTIFIKAGEGNTANPLTPLYNVLSSENLIDGKASVLGAVKLVFGNITKIFGATTKLDLSKSTGIKLGKANDPFSRYKTALWSISEFINDLYTNSGNHYKMFIDPNNGINPAQKLYTLLNDKNFIPGEVKVDEQGNKNESGGKTVGGAISGMFGSLTSIYKSTDKLSIMSINNMPDLGPKGDVRRCLSSISSFIDYSYVLFGTGDRGSLIYKIKGLYTQFVSKDVKGNTVKAFGIISDIIKKGLFKFGSDLFTNEDIIQANDGADMISNDNAFVRKWLNAIAQFTRFLVDQNGPINLIKNSLDGLKGVLETEITTGDGENAKTKKVTLAADLATTFGNVKKILTSVSKLKIPDDLQIAGIIMATQRNMVKIRVGLSLFSKELDRVKKENRNLMKCLDIVGKDDGKSFESRFIIKYNAVLSSIKTIFTKMTSMFGNKTTTDEKGRQVTTSIFDGLSDATSNVQNNAHLVTRTLKTLGWFLGGIKDMDVIKDYTIDENSKAVPPEYITKSLGVIGDMTKIVSKIKGLSAKINENNGIDYESITNQSKPIMDLMMSLNQSFNNFARQASLYDKELLNTILEPIKAFQKIITTIGKLNEKIKENNVNTVDIDTAVSQVKLVLMSIRRAFVSLLKLSLLTNVFVKKGIIKSLNNTIKLLSSVIDELNDISKNGKLSELNADDVIRCIEMFDKAIGRIYSSTKNMFKLGIMAMMFRRVDAHNVIEVIRLMGIISETIKKSIGKNQLTGGEVSAITNTLNSLNIIIGSLPKLVFKMFLVAAAVTVIGAGNYNTMTAILKSVVNSISDVFRIVAALAESSVHISGSSEKQIQKAVKIVCSVLDVIKRDLGEATLTEEQASGIKNSIDAINVVFNAIPKLIINLLKANILLSLVGDSLAQKTINGFDNLSLIMLSALDNLGPKAVTPEDVVTMKDTITEFIDMLATIDKLVIGIREVNKKLSWVTDRRSRAIVSSIGRLALICNRIVNVIDEEIDQDRVRRTNKTINLFLGIVRGMFALIVSLILITPAILLFALAAPAVIIGFWLFSMVLKVLIYIISEVLADRKLIMQLVFVGLFILGMIALCLEIMIFSIVAKQALQGIGDIILFMLGLIVVAGVIALFGYAMSFIQTLMMPAITGVAMIGIAVLAVLAIAGALWLLQNIELDQEAIKTNVRMVIGTAIFVFAQVFEELKLQIGGGEQNQDFLAVAGLFINGVLGALLSSVILLISVISVAAILYIAGMLWLIQNIKLDRNKIRNSVRNVIDAVMEIYWALFGADENDRLREEGAPEWLVITDMFFRPIRQILQAFTASITLMLSVFAVGSVLLIATCLRLLQNLNLNKTRITNNVQLVIGIVRDILAELFDVTNTEKEAGSNGILGSIISWIWPGLNSLLNAFFAMGTMIFMLASIGCILGIAKMLESIADLNVDKINTAKKRAGQIIGVVRDIMAELFGDVPNTAKEMANGGLVGTLLGWVWPPLKSIVDAILSIAFLGLSMLSIGMVKAIGEKLIKISEFDTTKLKQAATNAKNICLTARNIAADVFAPDDTVQVRSNKNWLEGALDWLGFDSEIIEAFMNLGKFAILNVAIGSVAKLANYMDVINKARIISTLTRRKALNIITAAGSVLTNLNTTLSKYDEDDMEDSMIRLKLVGELMGKIKSLAGVMDNIGGMRTDPLSTRNIAAGIIGAAASTFDEVNRALIYNTIENTRRKMSASIHNFDLLRDLYTKYTRYGSQETGNDVGNARKVHAANISCVGAIFHQVDGILVNEPGVRRKMDLLDRINSSIKGFVKVDGMDVRNSRMLVDNYIRFIERVDRARLASLKTTEQLMKHWADLSMSINGNFDKLAESINEHIMPALKELDKTMDGVTKTQQKIIQLMESVEPTGNGDGGGADTSLPTGDTIPEGTTPEGTIPSGSVQDDGNGSMPGGPKNNGTQSTAEEKIITALNGIRQAISRS